MERGRDIQILESHGALDGMLLLDYADAMAILLALYNPRINLIGISTVAGNMPIDKTTKNALDILNVVGQLGQVSTLAIAMISSVSWLWRNLPAGTSCYRIIGAGM